MQSERQQLLKEINGLAQELLNTDRAVLFDVRVKGRLFSRRLKGLPIVTFDNSSSVIIAMSDGSWTTARYSAMLTCSDDPLEGKRTDLSSMNDADLQRLITALRMFNQA